MGLKPAKGHKTRWYQRKLIVNFSVQRVFIFYMITMGGILFCLGGLFSNLWLRILVLRETGAIVTDKDDVILLGVVLGTLAAGTYVGFLLTNRVAGPIFRLSREMMRASRGEELRPIHFRKDDYFLELAEAYNKLILRIAQAENKKKKSA